MLPFTIFLIELILTSVASLKWTWYFIRTQTRTHNTINMGIVASLAWYGIYRCLLPIQLLFPSMKIGFAFIVIYWHDRKYEWCSQSVQLRSTVSDSSRRYTFTILLHCKYFICCHQSRTYWMQAWNIKKYAKIICR